ncbi:OmpA family protein [Nevskia ramosa]|uniref:OmpA family protein n=1 Tax=Nevskia ramosa TaxID=64002 RepID=UPI002356BFCB|nr:OmpA family protein [Nevskia ramosa]
MNKKMTVSLLGASLLGLATSATAQNRAEAWTLTPYAGGYLFDSKQDLESAPVFGLRGGYNFTENWGAELFGSYVLTESDTDSGPNVNVESNVYRFGGNLLYHFQPTKKLVPFIAIGAGRYNIDVPDLNRPKTNKTLAEYGGGLKYFVGPDFALRADIRHVLGFSPSIGNFEYSFGVTWEIGGVRPAVLPIKEVVPQVCESCAPPPPRVDSDGDGVEDALDKCPNTPKGFRVDSTGCVIEQTVVLRAVNFVLDGYELTAPAKATLDEVSSILVAQPTLSLQVSGHTDSTGSDQYNQKLSQRRADSVRTYLISKNVDASRVIAKGYGESEPISSNESPEGRADNRRVEFKLLDKPSFVKVYNEESSRASKNAAKKSGKKTKK